jgi:HEAT repeat protein
MNTQTIRVASLCLAFVATQAFAAELTLPKDGWTSWQVEAVEGAPDWCCWSGRNDGDASRASCKLDEDSGNFGSRDKQTTDSVRVYARVAGGKIERLRVLSATCPVEARTPIHELGNVAADDSARWLTTLSKRQGTDKNDDFQENVLAGLAMHRGDLAQNSLTEIARANDRAETRKKAIFWLALLRGTAGAEAASSAMFNDKDPQVRQHAAFAITESKLPNVAEHLIRLGNTDSDGEVRAQAWFWLAHTGAPGSEAAITAALKKDKDDQVREQAIFALSQLPNDRATRALVTVAEDRSLSHEQRKRAVFWLVQSESEDAQKYLERC